MKSIFRLVALVAALTSGAVAQASQVFNFSYTISAGEIVTGSFTGTENGNLITGLSNVSVSANGVALNGSGSLFNASYNGSNFVADTGVVSVDGTQNNFLFVDSHYPANMNYTNFFYSIINNGSYLATAAGSYSSGSLGNWSVTAVNAVPEPASLALLGLGLLGLAMARKRQKQG